MTDSFKARSTLSVGNRSYEIWSMAALPPEKVARLPYSLKILLENLLRFEDGVNVTRADIEALLAWDPAATPAYEIAFTPARVILQDFTGVPCIVDLAAMRDAIVRLGGDAERVNPLAPAELVIGFRLDGRLQPGATATDLVLTVTEILRKKGVVDKFVEFFGDGLANLPLADRATIANMAPEYGSTCGIFPIDEETLRYLELTGRPRERLDLVTAYAKQQGLWRTNGDKPAQYSDVLELNLGNVEPSLAGPRRPQDRVALKTAKSVYQTNAKKTAQERAAKAPAAKGVAPAKLDGQSFELKDGAVLIAAITSCTNTSNPSVMLAAGLLARKARERGLKAKPWVKTSLAPGSRVVTDYFRKAGVLADLAAVGFELVGYGCTTCIAADTPILLANGTSRRIEQMPAAGGARVFGPTGDGRLSMAVQTEMMVQGQRECLSVVLQDGRTLVCTPDHKILCADGRWVRADELVIGRDRVVMGLEAPVDEPGSDERGYELIAGALQFSLANEHERG